MRFLHSYSKSTKLAVSLCAFVCLASTAHSTSWNVSESSIGGATHACSTPAGYTPVTIYAIGTVGTNAQVYQVNSGTGAVTTLGSSFGWTDKYGSGLDISPMDIAADSSGNAYVLINLGDPKGFSGQNLYAGPIAIVKVTPGGVVSSFIPTLFTGPASSLSLYPRHIAVTSDDNVVYEADGTDSSNNETYYMGEVDTSTMTDSGVYHEYSTGTTYSGTYPSCIGLATVGDKYYICGAAPSGKFGVASYTYATSGDIYSEGIAVANGTTPTAMTMDTDGNMYACGNMEPGGSYTWYSGATICVEPNGTFKWVRYNYGTNGDGYYANQSIAWDGGDYLYVAGRNPIDPGLGLATTTAQQINITNGTYLIISPMGRSTGIAGIVADSTGCAIYTNDDYDSSPSGDPGFVWLHASTFAYYQNTTLPAIGSWDINNPPGMMFKDPNDGWYGIVPDGLYRLK